MFRCLAHSAGARRRRAARLRRRDRARRLDSRTDPPGATPESKDDVAADSYRLVNTETGLCLTVGEASLANGAVIGAAPGGDADHQRRRFRVADDWFQLVAAHSDKCLDVK